MKPKHTDGSSGNKSPSAKSKPGKTRLDVLIFERGLVPSRERAQALLLAGSVLVNGQKMEKPGSQVASDARVELIGESPKYVGRGGVKLEGALRDFGVAPIGQISLDVGSSTGGFTDCLLQHGATRVYAADVSSDQLDWKLRKDARVIFVECNARYLQPKDIAERATLVTMDVSFISVVKVLPAVVSVAARNAEFLILIKPQFELEKSEIGKGGIVKDASLHQKAIDRAVQAAASLNLEVLGIRPSQLAGTEGNQEFFLHARARG
jgi:23S rRNA (cytidine1920-2'-O)/16S rRNA (cytidine1409-2'-O)-methyltransferase